MDKSEQYDRARSLTDDELVSQARSIYRRLDREGDHFMAGVIQEMWLRMRKAQAISEILKRDEEL